MLQKIKRHFSIKFVPKNLCHSVTARVLALRVVCFSLSCNKRLLENTFEFEQKDLRTFRDDVRIVIFEAGTRAGKAFDVGLIVFILASVVVVMLDSVPQIHARYGEWLYVAEWAFILGIWAAALVYTEQMGLCQKFFTALSISWVFLPMLLTWIDGSQYFFSGSGVASAQVFRVLRMVRYVARIDYKNLPSSFVLLWL